VLGTGLAGQLIREARLEAGLSQADLAARAGTSQPAVARYVQAGSVPTLATLERLLGACGRRPIVSTGSSTPPTAQSTVTPPSDLLRQRRERLLAAAARRGARNVRVFGSVGRGEQRVGSDVDLLVDLSAGRTLLDLVAFRREASEVLGLPVDVATPDMLKDGVRDVVLAEAARL
jgi:predicted nucleotidyltransferase